MDQTQSVQNNNGLTDPEPDTSIIVPRGQYKSGRFWKSGRPRFSSVNQVKSLKLPLGKKDILRQERRELLVLTNSIKEEKLKRKEELREKQVQNKKMRTANERKAEVVQVVSNSRKLKRMSRKQLRKIETRDTT